MILGIEWVVHRAIGLFFISEFKAWNVVWFAENSLADEDNNGDYDRLVDGVSENVSPHDFSNNGSVLVIWLSLKNGVIWWLSSQSKSGEGIHDQVNPEHLNGSQWGFSKDGRSSEDNEHSNNVDGKLELKELSNVIIDVSSEFKSNNNGGEVIIQKNDITGTFGDISTSNSHSKSNIGLGQSWGIIGTITSYGDNTFLFLNTSNENKLVLWGRSSQNFQVLDNFDEFSLVLDTANGLFGIRWIFHLDESSNSLSEVLSGHAGVLAFLAFIFSDNSGVLGNSNGGVDVVSSAHDGSDTSSSAFGDRCGNSISQWVLKSEETNGNKVSLEALSIDFFSKIIVVRFQLVVLVHGHILVGDQKGSVGFMSEFLDGSVELFLVRDKVNILFFSMFK